jgi:uncharacterized membrane protein
MIEALFAIVVLLSVLVGPWVFAARVNARRKREHEENQEYWRDAISRIYELELAVKMLQAKLSGSPAEKAQTQPEPAVAAVSASASELVPEPRLTKTTSVPTASVLVAEAWVTKSKPPATVPMAGAPTTSGTAEQASAPPPSPEPEPASPVELSQTPSAEDQAPFESRIKSSGGLEETVGANWLNKLGIVILVLGVAFFLAYQLKTLGPAGKVLVGFLTSAALLAAGIWLERRDRYRILARAGIGGGWALLFFTTYAMYHVPAAQVLASQLTDLVLMLIVAAAMVGHTLRYRSQLVTGLAFLLAWSTVTISHSNVYSLSAGVILAAGLVLIIVWMHWYELEAAGIAASYLNHYLWLRPIIEPMHGHHQPFPEFAASAAILGLYWLIFRLSYVFRTPSDDRQERMSTAAALLNPVLLLLALKYQSVHKEWAFWALLVLGGLETLLSQLALTRRRRSAVIVLSTIGVVLLIAAFPFRYSGERLSVLWLMESEALLLIGVWTKEIVFRRLGMLALIPTSIQMISVNAAVIFGRRMDGADLRPDYELAIVFVVAAAAFYANAHWIVRRWADLFNTEFDRRMMQRASYAAAIMLLFAAWIAFPEAWTAVAWSALGLAMMFGSRRLATAELGYEAVFVAAISVVRVLAINIEDANKFHGMTLRLVTILLVSALLYLTTRWNWSAVRGITTTEYLYSFEQLVFAGYTWAASFLLALVSWYELRSVSVADAWAVGGLLLLEFGLSHRRLSSRLQGYTAFAASFLRIFFVNLNAAGNPGEISPRFYTVVPIAFIFFYAYWRLHDAGDDLLPSERKFRAEEFCCWMGTITLAALVRFELDPDWVAAAWAALIFTLMAIAWRCHREVFRNQGLLISAGVLFRTILHNLYQRSYFPAPAWDSRWATVGAAVGLLLMSLPLTFQLREKGTPAHESGLRYFFGWITRRPEQVMFFIAVALLTVLLAKEMRYGMVTLAWGIEGVAVFLLALKLGERSFRLTGLGLLLLCVGKIVLVDVWRLNPQDRYITFIVLGIALLLVSFLYTRNREALRQYL